MMTSKVDTLLRRTEKFEFQGSLTKYDYDSIEQILSIILSNEFKKISACYSYEHILTFEFHCFPDGVVERTEYYRQKGLPHRYIILADEGDGGIVLMETQDDRDKPSPVIWCDYPDIFNLCECGEFKLNPDIWPSFTDFFEYLVEQEEKLQNEELS